MKIPYFNDTKAKRRSKHKGLFKHFDELIAHLTPQERDQIRRFLTNEFKLKRDQREKRLVSEMV